MTTDFIYELSYFKPASLLFLGGATASGKSDLAIALAQKYDGVIINADSMQIFKEPSLLTARPSENDHQKAPHKLYGFLSINDSYCVTQWCEDVCHEIKDCFKKQKLPIIVGGTGLYFHTLMHGIAQIPDIHPDIRTWVRTLSVTEIQKYLQDKDPVSAKILHPNDTQRLSRALEVIESTGTSLQDWYKNPKTFLDVDWDYYFYILNPAREKLYHRIDRRFIKMLNMGGLDEARLLMDMGFHEHLTGMKAVGIPELIRHLKGEYDLETAIFLAQTASRQYAKRQMTWFRNKSMGIMIEPHP